MGLTQVQKSLLERTRSVGAARECEALTDADCLFLVATIARDLGLLPKFPELPEQFPEFFEVGFGEKPQLGNANFVYLFERLIALAPNVDSFFACLGTLYKVRLKYANILKLQPIPTMDQIGPRGLLQYGSFSTASLTAFLMWRKWIFDVDNRAGQETGYLFEPIIAAAIGGTPASSQRSPVHRAKDNKKGRQVDCLKGNEAYEIKLRVTIAASGQGRWSEELEFPIDCKDSGYTPVLIVFDPTPNPKLQQLKKVFLENNGKVFIGEEAWRHLDDEAGLTMARFLDKYVRAPIKDLLVSVPNVLPKMTVDMADSKFTLCVNGDVFSIDRTPSAELSEGEPDLPEDVDEQMPGV